MKRKIAKNILEVLPQNSLSRTIGKMAASKWSKSFIKPYSKYFDINVNEAEKSLNDYTSLTDFFTRRLKNGLRAIDSDNNTIVSPVDGVVSELGKIENGTLIQAKGINYSVQSLLGCNDSKSKKYEGGSYITIYLSPKDYHRIHMPYDGKLTEYVYIPGRLFPVNKIGVNEVKCLFTKNERVITYANSAIGEIAIVKVGAFIVGSVDVSYGEVTTNKRNSNVNQGVINKTPNYKKGEEVGLFKFGSTVILLFEKDSISFFDELKKGKVIKMGERIAKKESE